MGHVKVDSGTRNRTITALQSIEHAHTCAPLQQNDKSRFAELSLVRRHANRDPSEKQ